MYVYNRICSLTTELSRNIFIIVLYLVLYISVAILNVNLVLYISVAILNVNLVLYISVAILNVNLFNVKIR